MTIKAADGRVVWDMDSWGFRAGRPAHRLIAPTLDITRTGQEEVLDGVRIVFQMTPGTEAPPR